MKSVIPDMEKKIISSTDRVVNLLTALQKAGHQGAGVSDLASEAGLAAATAHRMLVDLERAGYAYRTDARHWFANYSFSRELDATAMSLGAFRRDALRLSRELNMASEIVFLRGQSLVWHAKFEPADQSIQLRAHAGFVRTTSELDALSRLALAHLPMEMIEASWDRSGFHGPGVNGARLTWDAAKEAIASVDPTQPQFDMQGNSKGVRRFAIAIGESGPRSVSLLTGVEAAIPVGDAESHQARILGALIAARDAIESQQEASEGRDTLGGKP